MRVRILLAMLVLAAAPVSATDTTAEGGPGGDPFSVSCGDGRQLVGLFVGYGDWIDQVRPICGIWSTDSHRFQNIETGRSFGTSPGPIASEHRCPRGYSIVSLSIWPTLDDDRQLQFVDDILVDCETIEPPQELFTLEIRSSETDPGKFVRDHYYGRCPEPQVAVGIHGRAGQFVDALGLVCGAPPHSPGAVPPGQQPTTFERPGQPDSHVGQALGGTTCLPGFVRRLAGPADDVCVPPESHARVIQENATAASRRDPKGKFGPDSCITGYVWRGAFAGDAVCVTPQIREVVRQENALASSRSTGATQLMRP